MTDERRNGEYEEKSPIDSDIPGLTLYDIYRKPRTPITDDSTTTIQIRNLNVELTCPVCLGILHDTMTVMECLHRFCSECINKSLRLGKRECPTCRVKCSSKRHLRPDPNLDAIIAQIYPNLDEFEAKEVSMIEQINKEVMQNGTLLENVELGKKRQALAKAMRPKKHKEKQPSTGAPRGVGRPRKYPKEESEEEEERDPMDEDEEEEEEEEEDNDDEDFNEEGGSRKRVKRAKEQSPADTRPRPPPPPVVTKPPRPKVEGAEISFVLLKHDNEKVLGQLTNKYLRTSNQLTVKHLCKFLSKKFDKPQKDYKMFKIGLYPNSQPLTEDITLEKIQQQLWRRPEELVLYYRLSTA